MLFLLCGKRGVMVNKIKGQGWQFLCFYFGQCKTYNEFILIVNKHVQSQVNPTYAVYEGCKYSLRHEMCIYPQP